MSGMNWLSAMIKKYKFRKNRNCWNSTSGKNVIMLYFWKVRGRREKAQQTAEINFDYFVNIMSFCSASTLNNGARTHAPDFEFHFVDIFRRTVVRCVRYALVFRVANRIFSISTTNSCQSRERERKEFMNELSKYRTIDFIVSLVINKNVMCTCNSGIVIVVDTFITLT